MTTEDLRAMGITEHRDERGRPVLKKGDLVISRGWTLEQFAALKTVEDSLSAARTERDYLQVCTLFIREMQLKNHPRTHDMGREIDFYLQLVFGDSDKIWKEAYRIAQQHPNP